MTDDQHPHVRAHLISQDELERAGVHLDDSNTRLPEVDHSHDFVVEDYDRQQSRYISREELAPIYLDNCVDATPVQADVWTLETDNEHVTVTYLNGAQYTFRLGDVDVNGGAQPEQLVLSGGLVYPMSGGAVVLNTVTTPRLAHMRAWILEQTLQISEDRLKMAELVAHFASDIGHLGHVGGDIGHLTAGPGH